MDRLPVPTIPVLPEAAIRPLLVTSAGVQEAPDVVGFTAELVYEWQHQTPYGVEITEAADGVRVIIGWPGKGLGRVVYRVFGYAPLSLVYVAERIV